MVSVSFTGTRKGITDFQESTIRDTLHNHIFTFDDFHHGDCKGADEQFHNLVIEHINKFGGEMIIHPPDNNKHRAFCEEGTILPEKPYLERNKDIVDACDLIIATPHRDDEINKQRSGTWSTIRYAKKQKKDIIIII